MSSPNFEAPFWKGRRETWLAAAAALSPPPQPARSQHRRSLLRQLPEPRPCGGPRAPGLPLSPAYFLAPLNFSRPWDPAPAPLRGSLSRGKAGTASRLWRRVTPLSLPRRGETRVLRPRRGKRHSALLFGAGPGFGCAAKRLFLLPCPGNPLLLPAPLPGAARSPPGDPSAWRAGGLSLPLGGKEGGQRGHRRPGSRRGGRGWTGPALPLL